ncbi:MAG: large-conductance mechanosensitive channel protein MscL [Oscillospiraceae bacterium]|nr:large-conductance mechanosensitive channel protein MscL [Oscillospiraceae bacterium]
MAEDQKPAAEKKPNVFVRIGKEFHTFISRGNVIDMAVGVIIGGAFTAIVNSLVNDILMPIISAIMAGINLKALAITLPWSFFGMPRVQILIGSFLQAIITFLLTAICVFLIVKIMNVIKDKMTKKKEEAPAAPPAPDPQLVLLTEIRDLLKAQAAYYETDTDTEETEE